MRLIDADALPIWSYTQMWEEGQGIKKCCDAVENAPTIEAIPVEWILNSIKDMKPYYAVWEQRMGLIREWREEHEID